MNKWQQKSGGRKNKTELATKNQNQKKTKERVNKIPVISFALFSFL
jgi:hypothetical protein